MTGTWGPDRAKMWRGPSLSGLVCLTAVFLLAMSLPVSASTEDPPALLVTELDMGLPLTFDGFIEGQGTNGAFTMGPLDHTPSDFALRIQAAKAELTVVNLTETSLTGTQVGDRVVDPIEGVPEVYKYGPYEDAMVRLDEAAPGFFLLAKTDDKARLSMEPLSREAVLDEAVEGHNIWYQSAPGGNHHSYNIPEEMLSFTGKDPFAVVEGDFSIVLFESTFTLDHAQGTQKVSTGKSEGSGVSSLLPDLPLDPPTGTPGADPMKKTYSQYSVLKLEDARLAVRALGPEGELVTSLGSTLIDVNGVVTSPSLLGSVQIDGDLVRAQGAEARMEGVFTMQPKGYNEDGRVTFTFDGNVESLSVGPQEFLAEAKVKQAAGIAILLAGAGAALWQLTKSGLLVTLYAKLTRRKVLDQATRQQVHDKVREDPGCTTRSVSNALGISWSTAAYHLRVLRHMGLVTAKRQGRHEHFFVTGESSQSQQVVQAVLQNPMTRRIANLITQKPGIIQKEICEQLEIAPSTASDHLKRLRDAEAVREEREWRTRAYHPSNVLVANTYDNPTNGSHYPGLGLPMAQAESSA